jgi:hypothetical protein
LLRGGNGCWYTIQAMKMRKEFVWDCGKRKRYWETLEFMYCALLTMEGVIYQEVLILMG